MIRSLRIAAAQFPVCGSIDKNYGYIRRYMTVAAERNARVVHFPEGALSGYAPKHFPSLGAYPWEDLAQRTRELRELAVSLGIWLVFGSMRRVDGQLSRNCLLVVSDAGAVRGVYDKRRLYEAEKAVFSRGETPCLVSIDGIRCGFLICYENCFPELYDEYRRMGVELVFHSFYNAANSRATSIQYLMWATLIVRAADNQLWVSAANSSEPYSSLPACIVRPDGSSVRAKRNVSGLVIDDYPAPDLGWTYDNRVP